MRSITRVQKWGVILAGLHLILALVFCFLVFPRLGEATSGLDPDGYGHLGRILYETGRFDSVEKPPLYPAFLALVSLLVGGYNIGWLQTAQCLVSAIWVGVVYALFQRTLPDKGVACLAGLTVALYPLTLWYVPRLWTETFLTLWITIYTWTLVRLVQAPTWQNAALCGLAAGLAALTKGVALVLGPPALVALLIVHRRDGWRPAIIFVAALLALLLPWTVRNWRVAGALLPVHAEGGYNFFLGNGFARHWLQAPLSYVRLKDLTEADMPATPEDPIGRDRVLLRAGLRQMTAEPGLAVRKTLAGGLSFWYLAADTPKSLLTAGLQLPVVLLAALGVWRWLKRRGAACWIWVLLIPAAGIWAASTVVFAFGRLSAPVMPYLLGLAVYGLFPQGLNKKPDGMRQAV